MKRIIIFTVLIVFIPFFIVLIFNKEEVKEIKLNYVNNQTIRVKRLSSDKIDTIPLEEYIVGVLAGEMPIYFELEALKAQAVASRSYAMKRIEYNKENEYDVVDSVLNQVYLDDSYLKKTWGGSYVKNINKIRTAVNATLDEVLVYDDKIIDALFFSTSNGYTEDSNLVFNLDLPYLKSVESNWDEKTSSVFKASNSMSLQEFYDKLGLSYNKKLNIEKIEKSKSGRIIKLKINGKEIKAREMYEKLKLKSTDFEINQVGSNVVINTKGYGHGVGLSQYGAEGMAKEGYKYDDILKHYYTGIKIKKI